METIVSGLHVTASYGFIIYFSVLFYLSLKKCFLTEGKSKIKLFFLSLFTSPYLSYVGMVFLSTLVVFMIDPKVIENVNNRTSFAETDIFVLCFIIAVVYLLINLLFAWLVGKWLGVSAKSSVVYLYMMFNTLAIMIQRPSGTGMMFSVPYLRDLIDIIGDIILFFAVWIFYRLNIRVFSKMSHVHVKVNWKLFNIPPAVFIALYTFYVNVQQFASDVMDEDLVLAIYIFFNGYRFPLHLGILCDY